MSQDSARAAKNQRPTPSNSAAASTLAVCELTDEHQSEVLNFLAARPQHTVYLTGLVRDNGLSSPLNRGTFYGCRNTEGTLEGVALIGHATLFETHRDEALEAFAALARNRSTGHLILGEQEKIEKFWRHYATEGSAPRLVCRELLYEQRWPVPASEKFSGLRLATASDIECLLPLHGAMAAEESGVNPLEVDPEGFRRRYARRIAQGRVWLLIEGDRLIFKADIVSDTPDAVYLEGIYVADESRGQGYGLRCLTQLSVELLSRSSSIVLLVNEQNADAIKLYQRAGFKLRAVYDTVFLRQSA